jgi:hypothetical protein
MLRVNDPDRPEICDLCKCERRLLEQTVRTADPFHVVPIVVKDFVPQFVNESILKSLEPAEDRLGDKYERRVGVRFDGVHEAAASAITGSTCWKREVGWS